MVGVSFEVGWCEVFDGVVRLDDVDGVDFVWSCVDVDENVGIVGSCVVVVGVCLE